MVLPEVGAAALHLDEHNGLPDVVGIGGAAAILPVPADAELGAAAHAQAAGLAEGAEETVEEYLGLALLIPRDVVAAPGGEDGEVLRNGHAGIEATPRPPLRRGRRRGAGLSGRGSRPVLAGTGTGRRNQTETRGAEFTEAAWARFAAGKIGRWSGPAATP